MVNYSIENLDVYRKSVATGANLCREAAGAAGKGSPLLADQLQRTALAVVTNLADGLGFWESEQKERHFTASKKAVLEILPLLEVMSGLGLVGAEEKSRLSDDLRDLAKMISGLLRGARLREKAKAGGAGERAEAGGDGATCH